MAALCTMLGIVHDAFEWDSFMCFWDCAHVPGALDVYTLCVHSGFMNAETIFSFSKVRTLIACNAFMFFGCPVVTEAFVKGRLERVFIFHDVRQALN